MTIIFVGGALALAVLGGFMLLCAQAVKGMISEGTAEEGLTNSAVVFYIIVAIVLLMCSINYLKLAYGL